MSVPFARVVAALEALAPLHLAAPWDNVGLLLEPPGRPGPVRRILLTIDCTAPVVAEARALRCELIVSYHPPIFAGLKALRASDARTGGLLRAAAGRIAIYSPHTALDAAEGGLDDWLSEAFGPAEAAPLAPAAEGRPGPGRRLRLVRATPVTTILRALKAHLAVAHLRVARPPGAARAVREVALVPGAGGDLLAAAARTTRLDLVFTGEMRHHDVLAIVETGCVVVLAEHTSSERGYLPRLRSALEASLGRGVRVTLAKADRDLLRLC